jgi:hypothetical protein
MDAPSSSATSVAGRPSCPDTRVQQHQGAGVLPTVTSESDLRPEARDNSVGIIGRGRAERLFVRRGTSTAGIFLGSIAILLGVVGIVIITRAVNDVNNRFGPASANDSRITQDVCAIDQSGFAKASGNITNVSGHEHSFEITVQFLGSDGTQLGNGYDFKTLANNQMAAYEAGDTVPRGTASVTCKVAAK